MPHCHTFMARLRERGYRITPQREIVIEVIAHSGRHMSADDVLREAHKRAKSVNRATVYRTLEMLVEEGLATRANLGAGRVVYATGKHGPHLHLVCRHCGSVMEIRDAPIGPLLEDLRERYGFDSGPSHFAIQGLCRTCSEAGQKGAHNGGGNN
ncbi:transcriptional repressor [Candidatus Fermentibacterales bacterium]|nr:transcriptional repressor [Candidatus Fermentibacterales bacterium]